MCLNAGGFARFVFAYQPDKGGGRHRDGLITFGDQRFDGFDLARNVAVFGFQPGFDGVGNAGQVFAQRMVVPCLTRQSDGGTRQSIDGAPGGVFGVAEKAGIENGPPQERNLQASDGGLDAVRQIGRGEDGLEDHRERIEGDAGGTAQRQIKILRLDGMQRCIARDGGAGRGLA